MGCVKCWMNAKLIHTLWINFTMIKISLIKIIPCAVDEVPSMIGCHHGFLILIRTILKYLSDRFKL